MIVPVMAISNLVLTLQMHAHNRDRVPLNLEVISGAFCFWQELTSDEFLLCFVTRCFKGFWIFTDSDLLTRINMVKTVVSVGLRDF